LGDRIERVCKQFDAIVIDTGAADTRPARSALVAAQVAVLALTADRTDVECQPLAGLLCQARLFNPGLRVLVVPVGGEAGRAARELQGARLFAARIGSHPWPPRGYISRPCCGEQAFPGSAAATSKAAPARMKSPPCRARPIPFGASCRAFAP
jgi:hypothetical protein